MPCTCSDHWLTTSIAAGRGLSWKIATKSDGVLIKQFVDAGGTGNPSIDRFAREDLANHAGERYSNTHLLLNTEGQVIAFASNSMGIVKFDSQELMARNMEPVTHEVPALFLHRIGVLKSMQRQGLSLLLLYRLFEALRHVCGHTAAACVALYVDRENLPAKALYDRLYFQPVQTKDRRLELLALGYPEAMEHLSQLAQVNGAPGA